MKWLPSLPSEVSEVDFNFNYQQSCSPQQYGESRLPPEPPDWGGPILPASQGMWGSSLGSGVVFPGLELYSDPDSLPRAPGISVP